jgi:hypothetical protein
MHWFLSPTGIAVLAIIIVALTTLIYWKRAAIKKWFSGKKVVPTLNVGPVELSLEDKDKDKKATAPRAGVSFGEGNDFSGAKIRGVAGRDIRRGAGAAQASDGDAPGVDLGKEGKFAEAEIEDVAGRDVAED